MGNFKKALLRSCDEGSDETGCDFGTEYTTDLLQSSNLEDTVSGHLITLLMCCFMDNSWCSCLHALQRFLHDVSKLE